MTIPKHDELMPSVLSELAKKDVGAIAWKDLEEPLAKVFNLTEEEQSAEYESGNGRIFIDRIGWALSYLAIVKLVERPKRGYCKISEMGLLSLVGDDEAIKSFVKEKIAEHEANKKAEKLELNNSEENPVLISETTPDEALNQAFQNIRESVYEDHLYRGRTYATT